MESIYYSICWHCHRRCKHCYEERFRPYSRAALETVVAEAERNAPRIVGNFPDRMSFLDRRTPDPNIPGSFIERTGRIILSGGEVLTDPVRERVLYPTIEAIVAKYRSAGGVRVVIQTTGDLVTPAILEDLLRRGVWMISIAGMDDFHVGMEGQKREAVQDRLEQIFLAAGVTRSGLQAGQRNWSDEDGPVFSMFGATKEAWIGRIWPRGRGWANGLSRATIADNFCGAWSGGLGFLDHRYSGSEVSVEPDGNVFPCCLKTGVPIGSLLDESLTDILDSLAGHPVYEAINAGKPERMGLSHGWSIDDFYGACRTRTPQGADYANPCVGCDRFHRDVMGPVVAALREQRLAARSRFSEAAE